MVDGQDVSACVQLLIRSVRFSRVAAAARREEVEDLQHGLLVQDMPVMSYCPAEPWRLVWAVSRVSRQVWLVLPPSFGHRGRCLRGRVFG